MSTTNLGPIISKSSLVLDLDASARRSFLSGSYINMNNWTVSTGGVTGYTQNGNTAENQRTLTTNPWSDTDIIWGSYPSGDGNADGGWVTDNVSIDKTKLYRFSVWMKRTSSTTGGTAYLGGTAWDAAQYLKRTVDSVDEANPYWYYSNIASFTQDVWYLLVGHLYPYNTTFTGRHPDSGLYNPNNSTKVADIGGNTAGGDFKFASTSTYLHQRVFHYYCGDSTSRLQFYDPRVDLVDGKQPSIAELVSYSPAQWRNLTSSSINFTISNKPTYSATAKGSFNFNGSNTYFTAAEDSSFNTETFTIECWARTSNLNQNGFLFEKGNVNTQYALFFEQTNTLKLRTVTLVDGLSDLSINTSTYLTSNTWFLVTTSYNNGIKRIYINGTYLGTNTVTKPLSINTNGMSIGVYGGQNGGRGYYYSGDIGSLKFYNRVLTDSEVLQNYQNMKSKFGL